MTRPCRLAVPAGWPVSRRRSGLSGWPFCNAFPPPGVEAASRTVTMGIGQCVVPRLPASWLREGPAGDFVLPRAARPGEIPPNARSVIHQMKKPPRFPV
ncbi:hypothetical protein EVG18_32235 [Burkholderia pyrrocinia]|nr:hypothetical protein EVG18_32235 [Burkholderia pyrrocinia]